MKEYRVIRDNQGGDFALGRTLTAQGWLTQAYEWADQDDNEDLRNLVQKFRKNKADDTRIIEMVSDIWDLEIIEVGDMEEVFKEVKRKVDLLGWEIDRMSSAGQQTYHELCYLLFGEE